ncbi:transcriptional regulator family: Fungal Specific TF [Penicillium sp. IBT 18751x]|nr:transcriptional regulator family: Fungal Specific TF [Penicillium sp. IBT 18751x]
MPVAVEIMATTPNSQSAMDAANDKKRNKLGYHRTSVACVHCRRRKIRCLVAPDDPQGRCENCIRLRKDCQFFPVDQQPPVEKKSRPSSRLETASGGSATTPISSSPTNLNAESVDTFYQYPQVAMNSSGQDMSAFPPGAFAGNSLSGFVPDQPMGPGEFTRHPMEAGVWDEFTTISDPQMLATMNANKNQMMNLSPNVWPAGLPPNSPMSAASPMAGQAQPMNPGATYAMQPDGTVWQVPPQPSRAMSYPGQDMGSSFPQQFQPQMAPDLKRRMTTPAQTVASQGASGPTPDMQVPTGSYPAQAGMGFPQWTNMNAMPGMTVMQYPMYGNVPQQPFTHPPPMGHPGGPGRSGP